MVSVIIPVYNGEKYIEKCFASLFCGDVSSLEIIAVNDGSRDGSSELLHSYEEKFPKLRVIDKENGGAASARRKGLSVARGEFVAFLDIDDRAEPDIYSRLEAKALEAGADIVFCDYSEESKKGSRAVKNAFRRDESFPISGKRATEYLHSRKAVFPFPWNKIYRRALFDKVRFPEGNFVGEDYNMLLQLFTMTDKIDYLDAVGYHYELTDNSASRSGYSEATLRAYENFKEDRAFVIARYPEMEREVDNYLTTEFLAFIVAMGRNGVYNKEMIAEIKSFTRKNLWNYLSCDSVPLVMKGSAAVSCISYRLLVWVYKIIK